jgi:hypothetical protein
MSKKRGGEIKWEEMRTQLLCSKADRATNPRKRSAPMNTLCVIVS